MKQDSLLTIESLGKRWDDGIWALRDVSLSIPRGQFVVVLGSSGAGKSTLLNCINRLVRPTTGNVFLNDTNITSLTPGCMMKMRRKIGYIFQQFNLIETYTVRENVLAGRIGHNPWWRNLLMNYKLYDQAVVERYIRRVGLFDKIDSRVDQLSGGQRQRVAIARAAAQEPDIILADEPMASLDPKLSRVVLDLLTELSTEYDMTVIVNLHVLELARAYADRIIGLASGKLVFDGPASELSEDIIRKIYEHAPEEEIPY